MEDNFIIFHEDVLGYEFLLVWRNDNELVFCSRRKCIYGFLNHRLKRIIIIRYAEMSIFFFFEREKFWFISKNLYNNTSYRSIDILRSFFTDVCTLLASYVQYRVSKTNVRFVLNNNQRSK